MPTRRAETSKESRRLLIEAAATAFAAKGYRQTTVADVADLAGISRGSIPWHFGSKDGLLLAVVEHTFVGTADSMPSGPDGSGGFAEQLAAFIEQPINTLLISLLIEAMEPDSQIHDQYVKLHSEARRGYAEWAEELPPGLRLPDGLTQEDFGVLMVAATIGIHLQWRVAPDLVDLRRACQGLETLIHSALRRRG